VRAIDGDAFGASPKTSKLLFSGRTSTCAAFFLLACSFVRANVSFGPFMAAQCLLFKLAPSESQGDQT
jgi:hypothetical protein